MQSWDRQASQPFMWGRTLFVSPLSSMRLNRQGVRSASRTHTQANTLTLPPMGSLIAQPVYFGCEFGCPAGTWDWWTGRAVKQTADTHIQRNACCARDSLCQAATSASYKATKRGRGRGERAGRSVSEEKDWAKWWRRNKWVTFRKTTVS